MMTKSSRTERIILTVCLAFLRNDCGQRGSREIELHTSSVPTHKDRQDTIEPVRSALSKGKRQERRICLRQQKSKKNAVQC